MRPWTRRAVSLCIGIALVALGAMIIAAFSGRKKSADASPGPTQPGGLSRAPKPRPAPQKLPQVLVHIKGTVFHLQVALTVRQQAQGLMYLRRLGAHAGMLFVFRPAHREIFWMKHTWIPLDVIFLNRHHRVVQTYRMKPHGNSHELYPSNVPIRYAIELNAGWVRKLNITRRDVIAIPRRALKLHRQAADGRHGREILTIPNAPARRGRGGPAK